MIDENDPIAKDLAVKAAEDIRQALWRTVSIAPDNRRGSWVAIEAPTQVMVGTVGSMCAQLPPAEAEKFIVEFCQQLIPTLRNADAYYRKIVQDPEARAAAMSMMPREWFKD